MQQGPPERRSPLGARRVRRESLERLLAHAPQLVQDGRAQEVALRELADHLLQRSQLACVQQGPTRSAARGANHPTRQGRAAPEASQHGSWRAPHGSAG